MPLRAYFDGQEVIGPLVDDGAWNALRAAEAAHKLRIVLPCCGAEGFMRRSHLGTQHFAHKRASPNCDLQGETIEHLKAKAEIVRAARLAGYDASTEVAGDDWRADVLAERGHTRIAFEVQWSRLALDVCQQRQERYARDGIRGCWFFRRPPSALVGHPTAGGLRLLKARRDLPLFHLIASATVDFSVGLHGRTHPLDQFIVKLLSGGIRFCDQAVTRSVDAQRVVFFDLACVRCGYRSLVFALDGRQVADCGLPFHEVVGREAWADVSVLSVVADYARRYPAFGRRLGAIKPRDGLALTQGCVRCDHRLTSAQIQGEYRQQLRSGALDEAESVEVRFSDRRTLDSAAAHWCCPPVGVPFCCG